LQNYRIISNSICFWPKDPIGIIEFIGGSYLGSNPEITYKRFINYITEFNFAVHAWRYIPKFDHQEHAINAWKSFKICKRKLQERRPYLKKIIRVGHSLGCKLHFIAPDGGRNCDYQVSISFNNFNASESIPFLKRISQKLNLQSEFSPSPLETLNIISKTYIQRNNLLVKFNNDQIDQSLDLIQLLKKREADNSNLIKLEGEHLSLASAGIREKYFGNWADDNFKRKIIKDLAKEIVYLKT
tara:strand:+ start:7750 stop:8475 length:726 start_codon:yes stop_codon:yes gene_type:complete